MWVRRRGDDGQVISFLTVGMVLTLVAITVVLLVPLGRATDQREGAQTAGDAAALAGAQQVRNDAVDELLAGLARKEDLATSLTCGTGAGQAADLATRNGARIVRYCYDVADDRVEVLVEGVRNVQGTHVPARSVASVGARWGGCVWTDDPLPPPAPAPPPPGPPGPPAPPAPPAPPPDRGTRVTCGAFTATFVVRGSDGRLLVQQSRAELEDRLRPRLVS
jgi:hypothetical protein